MKTLNDELDETRRTLAECVNEYERWLSVWADAKTEYDFAWSQSYKTADGTQKLREAEATLQTIEVFKRSFKAEMMKDFLKVKINALLADLSAVQSKASTARVERSLAYAPESAARTRYGS